MGKLLKCSFCARLTDSSPPATMIGTRSTIPRWAAMAIACRPEEQKRLTVTPAVVTGSPARSADCRSEEHTSELQSRLHLVCRLLLEKKKPPPPTKHPTLTPTTTHRATTHHTHHCE